MQPVPHKNLHTFQSVHLPLKLSQTRLKKTHCNNYLWKQNSVAQITTSQIKEFLPWVPSGLWQRQLAFHQKLVSLLSCKIVAEKWLHLSQPPSHLGVAMPAALPMKYKERWHVYLAGKEGQEWGTPSPLPLFSHLLAGWTPLGLPWRPLLKTEEE